MKALSNKLVILASEPCIWCPACDQIHRFIVYHPNARGPRWTWNEDAEHPTFSPSMVVHIGGNKVCHSFVRDGKIEFLSDCYHQLRGTTQDLPDFPAWILDRAKQSDLGSTQQD